MQVKFKHLVVLTLISCYRQGLGLARCYIVQSFTPFASSRCMWHLFLPQGRHASVDEITACALNAIELDKKHGDEAVQVRVTMGKEPAHFLAIFKGKLVIYEVTWLCARGQWKVQAPTMAWQLRWK